MAAQGHLCHLPEILSPDPCNPMTCNAALLRFSACSTSEASPPPFNSQTRKPSPMKELQASLPGTKAGFFSVRMKRRSPCGQMLGPSRTSSPRTIGSFSRRKHKSSPHGPYLPGTFHCVEAVRRRTLSHASRKRPQDLFPQRLHQI